MKIELQIEKLNGKKWKYPLAEDLDLLKLIQTCIVVTLIPIDLTPNGFQFNSKSIGRL